MSSYKSISPSTAKPNLGCFPAEVLQMFQTSDVQIICLFFDISVYIRDSLGFRDLGEHPEFNLSQWQQSL